MKLPLTLALDDTGSHARCCPDAASIIKDDLSGELFVVELQGQLEIHSDDNDAPAAHGQAHAGSFIGKLDMSNPVS